MEGHIKIRVGDRVRIVVQRDDLTPAEAQPGDTGVVMNAPWTKSQSPYTVQIDRTGDHWYFNELDLVREEPARS